MPVTITLASPSHYVAVFIALMLSALTVFLATMTYFAIGSKPLTWSGLLVVLAMIYAIFAIIFIPVFRRYHIAFDQDGFTVTAGWYQHSVKWSQIDWAASGRLSAAQSESKKPRWRTNGIGAPGYNAGWFTLRDGRRAFLAITDNDQTPLLIATSAHDILLTAQETTSLWQKMQSFRH